VAYHSAVGVRLDDLVAEADSLLGVGAFDEGAPSNGLLVRAAGEGVQRIGASVNTSFEAIEAAHAAGVDFLLVHHPPWPHIDLGLQRQKEELLASYSISLYGAHASLDCATGIGTADALAELLEVRILGRFAEYVGGQAGIHGTAEGSFEAFIGRLEVALATRPTITRNAEAFGHVAIVAGGGGLTAWLGEAKALGADTYVTGEGSMFTSLYARETGLNLVLGTHYATEAPGIKKLAGELSRRLGLDWLFLEESDPSR
jgi:dinuclear metal center YbgI/SA1388 family protein